MQLTESMEKFVIHFGEMGSRWGVNRTVAQIFAVLYLAKEPMNAEQLTQVLGVARSNVSNSLKELQALELVRVTQRLGDRRDYFVAIKDCWQMLLILSEQRKQREIDPTIRVLDDCLQEAKADPKTDVETTAQLKEMHEFLTTMDDWYQQLRQVEQKRLIKFFKLGAGILKFFK